MWIDSHAHLMSDELFEDFDRNLETMKENKVKKALIICGNLLEIERALAKVENNPMFDLAVGLHPSSVADVEQKEFEEMMTYLNHPQVVAVGEIGLDYYWTDEHKDLQKQRFIEQINLANQNNLPIIVHLRSSKEDIKDILISNPSNKKGVIHCYTETKEYMDIFLNMGYYIGFGGILTFKNGENVRELLLNCPKDRILSETDAPYLAPVPKRGKTNQSSYVFYTCNEMAKLLGMKNDDLSSLISENYQRLFERTKL